MVRHLDGRNRLAAQELRVHVARLDRRARRCRHRSREWFGEAPANLKACDFTREGLLRHLPRRPTPPTPSKIWYWTTPIKQCLDGRTDVECTDYQDWTDAWTEIKG